MNLIEDDVAANYRALKSERGLSWEQLAVQAGAHGDRGLAAWMREQDAAETGAARAPKGRSAPAKSQA